MSLPFDVTTVVLLAMLVLVVSVRLGDLASRLDEIAGQLRRIQQTIAQEDRDRGLD